MEWFGDLGRVEGRIVSKDEAWVRAQPDVATAWQQADTPSRLCWIAALGARSDLLLLAWLETQTDALDALSERAPRAHAAIIAAVVADCRALLESPGASVESPADAGRGHFPVIDDALATIDIEEEALRAGLAPLRRSANELKLERLIEHARELAVSVGEAGPNSDEFAATMATATAAVADAGDPRISVEEQLLRAVVALRADHDRLVAARALAQSFDVATQCLGTRLLLARLEHEAALGNEKAAELLAGSGVDETMVAQIHCLAFEHYHESMDNLVVARARFELASNDARWADAQLARSSRFVLLGLRDLAAGEVPSTDDDDLDDVLGYQMEPLYLEQRRALLRELRADLTIPDDDAERAEEWEAIKREQLEASRAAP